MSKQMDAIQDAALGYMAKNEVSKKANVPPGYKYTEVGLIPEDWSISKVGALTSYLNGKAHERHISDDGDFTVVNSKFISSGGSVRKYSKECLCPTHAGDTLMVMSDVPNGRAIAKCFFVEDASAYTLNQRICALTPTNINPKLLFYKLDRNKFYLSFDDGAKQTNLQKNDVLACPIAFPTNPDEQQAIATALSDADALIESLDKLIAKKRSIKQATMQQLLTGKIRLPGFEGEWETKRLSELGPFYKGQGIKRNEISSEGLPCIRYGEIYTRHDNYVTKLNSYVPPDIAASAFMLKKGDLLFAGSGETAEEIGKCVAYLGEDEAYAGGDIVILRPKELNSLYMGYLMNHATVTEQKARLGQGDAVVHISAHNLGKLEVRMPAIHEQQAIATVLSDMDAEIKALERRRDKTKNIKQGMMQQLLTGRIRLVDPEVAA